MSVYLKPIVLVFSSEEAKYKILSMGKESLGLLEISPVFNSSPHDLINHKLNNYLIDNIPTINKFKLIDVEIVDDIINIYYIVFIGYETKIQNSHLISIDLNNVQLTPTIKQTLSLLL